MIGHINNYVSKLVINIIGFIIRSGGDDFYIEK